MRIRQMLRYRRYPSNDIKSAPAQRAPQAPRQRAFLRSLLLAASGAGISMVFGESQVARATLTQGNPDSFDGNVYVAGNLGVGIQTPAQRVDVAGSVHTTNGLIVNGTTAVDSNGVAQQSYYAP